MTIAIMQPYFFPYIGYWQLMNVVDKYVIFDDVNYINRGWINRNRILLGTTPKYINLPLLGASQNKRINEIVVNKESSETERVLNIIKEAYRKAPFFDEVFPIIREIMCSKCKYASGFIADSFRFLCIYLGINTERIFSSSIEKNELLHGEDKIIDICRRLDADCYINAIGGQALYHKNVFEENGIDLKFIVTESVAYDQHINGFEPNLSIIDVMMFNSREEVRQMLQKYRLIAPVSDIGEGGGFYYYAIVTYAYLNLKAPRPLTMRVGWQHE